LGETILKVDHAGEHGAVCIYRAQRWFARWRASGLVSQITHFMAHEEGHRALFAAELGRRGIRRCRSFHLCGLGGLFLGSITGLLGPRAIALTTEAVESIVLSHLQHQLAELAISDPAAAKVVGQIVAEEQEHHDLSADQIVGKHWLDGILRPLVRTGTEWVIRTGMRA
jgi:3-demethoxyubiquinol 3-hydroxylase